MEMCYNDALVMPSNCVVMEREEMTYLEGGSSIYISNSQLQNALISVGLTCIANPMGVIAAGVIASKIKTAATALGAKWGLLAGPKGSIIGAAIGLAISGFAASTIADALIQGKGIGIAVKYTGWGNIPYGASMSVK
ncbi:hypothetical protein RBH29_09765 [Herbivorax sp. ANBcel31]|uniref:hypothetical protein n=1 Tax=Herbivorax sp. ANBcel31 TaxID=3069754 RepID=UPI0027B41FBE|nr:hypothetical protein [Herbivorax sp. ANBcel31]MDQ2086711.1 hypothetical protein [Herbivorax sp. ANBcel31]